MDAYDIVKGAGVSPEEERFLSLLKDNLRYNAAEGHIRHLILAQLSEEDSIPPIIGALQWLESLELYMCHGLKMFPPEIKAMKGLSILTIRSDKRRDLPLNIGLFPSLKKLTSWLELLQEMPDAVFNLGNLKQFSIVGGVFPSFPDLFGNLKNLTEFCVSNNASITSFPRSFYEKKTLKRITIENCPQFNHLDFSRIEWESLEFMGIDECVSLKTLPPNLGNLASLRVLKLSGTPIAALPASLGGCAALEEIEIRDALAGPDALPEGIGQLKRLKSLTIYGGDLEQVPAAIAGCESLERLWLVACPKLREIPTALENLPRLKTFMADRCSKLTTASKVIARRLEAKFHCPRRSR
jgi:Leucine-rich repeat (LRR) protein